jgi:S-adenosylmethionine-diacylgycerolhomoserine-N-methlytransferase
MNSQTEVIDGHGQAMDRMYRLQRHVYDASRRYYLLGRDRLLDQLQPPHGGSVLEIGCGTGRNLGGVARRYPHAKLFGIDISQEMLKSALATMQGLHLEKAAKFACVDATAFDPALSLGQARFDRIYFSYTLSMVPQWQVALAHAVNLLTPTGELHIADFGQCENLPRAFRSLLFGWLGAFHVAPRPDLAIVLGQLAKQGNLQVHFKSCYLGYSWLASIKPQAASQ